MNKSLITNLIAGICVVVGLVSTGQFRQPILNIGLFALSGAITNWLAVYMLFERIPGIFGSGVVPAHFEDFKRGIHELIMKQFFTKENFARLFEDSGSDNQDSILDLEPVIENLDLNPAFNALISTIEESSFASMLGMFGGIKVLDALREPFEIKMKGAFKDITKSKLFQQSIKTKLNDPLTHDDMLKKVNLIVNKRLNELTPQIVKEIIQNMIRKHLGWLVVWGGVLGGIIGFITIYIPSH
ncbi:MAG: DUF445 domain-containing protein [Candidatus Anammoxibacter sp.]